jgi:hypothetical protein
MAEAASCAGGLTPINGGSCADANTDRTALPEDAMYQRILVPIDGSPTSDQGLD